MQEGHGHPADHQQATIGFVQGVAQRSVADISAAQEEILPLRSGPALRRVGDKPPQMHLVQTSFDPQERFGQLTTEEFGDPLAAPGRGGQVVDDLAARSIGHVDLRVRQRDPREHLHDVAGLRRVRLEERPADGGVEEQVPDLDHGPDRTSARLDRAEDSALDGEFGTLGGPGLARLAADLGDLGDRRQRLAPEAERLDAIQIIGLGELARGMRLEREQQVLGRHAEAVVGDPDQVLAAPFDRQVDPRGPGVDRVFQQLLDDARRPLDDFARRDLVDDGRRQLADDSHREDLLEARFLPHSLYTMNFCTEKTLHPVRRSGGGNRALDWRNDGEKSPV